MKPSLIVHGGAFAVPAASVEACKKGCREALEAGWKILAAGGSALDAVEAAVVALEDNPEYDAGTGSHLNRDGHVSLDAIVMDGRTLRSGAVAAVERIGNPIRLARKVMEASHHMLLAGAGAEQFAHENGFRLCRPEDLIVERERRAWKLCRKFAHQRQFHDPVFLFSPEYAEKLAEAPAGDHAVPGTTPGRTGQPSGGTVGAVAMDREGHLYAATSTGGTCCKVPGRVGDSPMIGCGCYADQEAGGVSSTGWGEAIMKIVMAKTAVDLLRTGRSAQETADESIRLLAARTGGTGGLILLDRAGTPAFAFSTPHMVWGIATPEGGFRVGV
ncbi:MAG TPA: isoaspartyl peptidase/L-asparaginase [Candidatus Acidoferrales bacterium]|nr:isoaspartyl peptidase/L-asparaginase [Candidatus Acidoferrales bacterium]